jgi:hypothetical protein
MRRSIATCLALAVMSGACGDDPTEPDVVACTDDAGSVTATVSSGTTPTFSWSPACDVAAVLVEGSNGDTWIVSSDDSTWDSPAQANLISSPIAYGTETLPAGVDTQYGPQPLTAGAPYDFILFQIVDPGSTTCLDLFGNVCRLVIHEFTP